MAGILVNCPHCQEVEVKGAGAQFAFSFIFRKELFIYSPELTK